MPAEPKLNLVNGVWMCDLCLDGAGGECHVPGCIMWINRAPDIPIRQHILDAGGTITSERAEPAPQADNSQSAAALWDSLCSPSVRDIGYNAPVDSEIIVVNKQRLNAAVAALRT